MLLTRIIYSSGHLINGNSANTSECFNPFKMDLKIQSLNLSLIQIITDFAFKIVIDPEKEAFDCSTILNMFQRCRWDWYLMIYYHYDLIT
jgi:hypothetical protein